MTTRTLTGTYASAYNLSNNYSGVSVASTGDLAAGLYVSDRPATSVSNSGAIGGVLGTTGSYPGAGGYGVVLRGTGTLTNSSIIGGGIGGYGGNHGSEAGAGGVGVRLAAGGSVTNSGQIGGGPGGTGLRAYYEGTPAGVGGAGGVGLLLAAGGSVTNTGTISGGAGGQGGAGYRDIYHLIPYGGYWTYFPGGSGGAGGAGVQLDGPGRVTNSGVILGGRGGGGGAAGPDGDGAAGLSGASGDAVLMNGGGTLINMGYVGGGSVYLSAGGLVVNGSPTNHQAKIEGLVAEGDATVLNYGTVEGVNASGRLVAEPGSTGTAGGGGDLELAAGAGTLSWLGGQLAVSGSINGVFNFGSYILDAGGDWTVTDGDNDFRRTLVNEATVTIASGATLTVYQGAAFLLAGARSVITGAAVPGARLDNYANISGVGWIVGSLDADNEAGGEIEANGAQGLVIDTGATPLTNAGILTSADGSALSLRGMVIDQSGSGVIEASAGGRTYLEDDTIVSGSVGVNAGGTIVVNTSGGELDGHSAGSLTLAGIVEVVNGASETLDGAIDDTGQLELLGAAQAAALIVGPDGVTLSGEGRIKLSDAESNLVYGQSASDTLTNIDDRIGGAGQLGDGKMILVNEAAGVIVGNASRPFTVDTGAATIQNAGVILNVGAGGTTVVSPIVNTGTLFAATAGTLTLEGAVTGAGVGRISGATLYAEAAFSEDVTFAGQTGVLELADSQAYAGEVSGLSKSGTSSLDLLDIAFEAGVTKASYSGTSASGTLTVTDGTHTARITLEGNYLSSVFRVASDGHGGTSVVDPIAAAVAQRFITASAAMPAPAAASLAGAGEHGRAIGPSLAPVVTMARTSFA